MAEQVQNVEGNGRLVCGVLTSRLSYEGTQQRRDVDDNGDGSMVSNWLCSG